MIKYLLLGPPENMSLSNDMSLSKPSCGCCLASNCIPQQLWVVLLASQISTGITTFVFLLASYHISFAFSFCHVMEGTEERLGFKARTLLRCACKTCRTFAVLGFQAALIFISSPGSFVPQKELL